MTKQAHKTYEAYKETGIDWLGEIPEGWEVDRLKSLIDDEQNGYWGDDPDEDESGAINCVRVADFDYDNLSVANKDEFTKRHVRRDRVQKINLKKGDLLVEKSGGGDKTPVGRVVQFDKDFAAVCANFIARLKIKKQHGSNFVNYLFSHLYSRNVNARSIKQTTGIQNLDTYAYFCEDIAIPPKEEQERIADFLDEKTATIDTAKEKNERLIAKLTEYKQALISKTVTKGLDPEAQMKETGIDWLGKVPQKWSITRLRFLSVINTGSKNTEDAEKGAQYPFYVRSPAIRRISNYSYDEEAVLTSGDGAGVCDIFHYVNEKYELHQRMYRISDFKKIEGKYFYYYMIANFKKDVMRYSAKSTVDSLRMYMFKNFPVSYGDKITQKRIVNFLDEKTALIDEEIEKLHNINEHLAEYKQSLISNAVTGKIKV